MNRIGFVNFWLYDEEDFEFVDGKLLLRGQNGSGKSITTQSFIPFVLDGDRTPSRLDPFGSSDRRMEYYFLGEEGKDESTGYLFLEFRKEDTAEYRTIGIGQRAKRGKPMDFWGFIILDDRRIGYDIWLYKEVGTTRIPYDKREMKTQLGEDNIFTDSQSEYKKYVNQHIFGFRKAEQYEQFIKLLVKVRAPKLSKEFKPTKVYDILNDSLQTLTDEDLRVMVDAMEKMDEIQDSLDMLKRAYTDVKAIRNEYIRYNQYMIAKKAQAYLAKKKEVETDQSLLDTQKQKRLDAENEQQNKSVQLEELKESRKLVESERVGLLDPDLEGVDRKLEEARKNKQEYETQERKWDKKIEESRERIFAGERKLKEIQNRLESKQQELLDEKRELEEQQEILQWNQHQMAIKLIELEQYEGTDEIVNGLDTYRKLIEECKKAIRRYEEIAKQYDEIECRLDQLRQHRSLCEQDLDIAQGNVINSIDQWIVKLFNAKKISKQWNPEEGLLNVVEEKIRQYQSVEDAGVVQELLRTDYERQRQILTDARSDSEYELNHQNEILMKTKEELRQLQNQEELEPERAESTRKTRAALQEAGIIAIPFYKTVEFADELNSVACARLEAQLQKMGIMDALIVSQQDFEKIQRSCPQFLDTVLYVEKKGNSHFSGLVVSETLGNGHREMVERILSNIFEKKGCGQGIFLGEDGSFRQGILAGRADKTGEAEFVGLLARKKRKEEKLQLLQGQLREYRKNVEDINEELDKIKQCLVTLQEEYQDLPGFATINDALAKEKDCNLALQRMCEQHNQEEIKERNFAQQKNEQYQIMLKQCKRFPYARTGESYDDVKEDLAHLDERIRGLLELEPKQTEKLKQAIAEETFLRKYFEEELSLKLVVEQGNRTLFECAKEAVGVIRENDKNRESSDMLNALYQVYQKHNGSLTNYGTSLEECFGTVDDTSIETEMTNMLRKRVQVVSIWNGKKVYLEEFYGILKSAIEETELLIQKKDRELFEDILSQTISQQLTDRIEESRKWVWDMSKLMKEMDTSMGLSFSLEWKPRKAENDTELDTVELEQILLRDRSLLTMEDIEKVAAHFRSKIHTEKQKLEGNGSVINYMDMVRDALDYRKWFEFQMYFRHGGEARKPLTNAAFNRFSGGEKAMAMYVPLFAAVNAQYQKAENKDHPRLIALDEAFAGVDDKNISSMFELVHKLDFDYIMNSQALWGCFETVKGLRIAELQRPQNSQTVSVIRYTWNGQERILDEQ